MSSPEHSFAPLPDLPPDFHALDLVRKMLTFQHLVRGAHPPDPALALHTPNYDALLLAHGVPLLDPPPSRPRLPAALRRACFYNAYTWARRRARTSAPLLYCEGYALNRLPLHHAWCLDPRTGAVLDNTWRPAGTLYLGLPIRLDFLAAHLDPPYGALYRLTRGVPLLLAAPPEAWLAPLPPDFKTR